MSVEEEYYINLHVGGKFIRDPHLRYLGGEMVRLKEDPDTISYFELCKIVKDGLGFNTVQLFYFLVPGCRTLQDGFRVVGNDNNIIDMINSWVKLKEIDLYVEHEIGTAVFVDDESMLVVACLQFGGNGNEGGEGGEVVGSKGGESKGEGGKVVGSKGGESDAGSEEGDRDENDSDSKDENTYLMKVIYLSDGDDDKELQEARQKVREVEGKTSEKGEETILDETKSESFVEQFKAEVPEKVDGEGLNDSVGKEKDGNKTKYFDSDDHECIIGSEDNDNTNICRRRNMFPTYNPNLASPHFCIEMLFKDATIGDYPEMKLSEIQRRVAPKMHVNVNMTNCRRAKKIMKDKLAGNFVQEFAMLWDYADELRLNNPESTIKMAVSHTSISTIFQENIEIVLDMSYQIGLVGRKDIRICFWKVVKSTIEREWEQNKEDLYKLDEDNNLCEAFNSSIMKSRFKRIITMFEEIRVNMMTRVVVKTEQCHSWEYNYGPLIKKKFDDSKKEGVDWKMISNGENGPAVLYGILNKILMTTYIVEKTMPGRPKKNRMKAKSEPKKVKPRQLSKAGLIMRCKKFGGEGHNKRSCIQPNTTGT
ncbi:hypothetical protein CXB51_008022 [Gossypium anomalum]|uniref:PB1-like domain-containing protein n=1 Tax=Gossypium anomalum TaxID=47600 RepID=A0A8J5ZEP5_9ROSI|nr:hypothetical protein CXB51_008022 [Gossypium anomalum]